MDCNPQAAGYGLRAAGCRLHAGCGTVTHRFPAVGCAQTSLEERDRFYKRKGTTEELRGALAASELSGLNLSNTELDKLCDGWRAGCPYPFEEFATKITKVPVPVLSLLRSRTGCSPAVVDRGSHFHAC